MEIAGFVARVDVWQWRRRGSAARGVIPAATALLVVAIGATAAVHFLGRSLSLAC